MKKKQQADRLLKRLTYAEKRRQMYIRRMIVIELDELATV